MLSPAQAPPQPKARISYAPAVALGILCAAVLAASFLHSDLTRNDFERFDDLRLLFAFFALFAGLCAVYVAVYLRRYSPAPRAIILTTAACGLLLWASFPVGSKDIFAYAFFGKIWGLYHMNPYVVTLADLPADPWQPFVQARWRNLPAAYGPLFLWQARAVTALSGTHLWAAVWLHKAIAFALWLATLGIARALLRRTTPAGAQPWLLTLIAWNPLLLFESAGGGHNDVAMVLLLVAALFCWHTRRHTGAFVLLALSIWYKWYGAIFLPAFLLETAKAGGIRATLRHLAGFVASMAAVGWILLWPLPDSLAVITGQLLHPGAMRGIYPTELSPPLATLFWSLKAAGLFDSAAGERIFDIVRIALFAVAVIAVLARQSVSRTSSAALIESCCLLGCAFFLTLITMLLPWHLLTVVVGALLCGREPFIGVAVVLTVLAMLSYFVTFGVATLMLVLIAAALWLLRRLPKFQSTAARAA